MAVFLKARKPLHSLNFHHHEQNYIDDPKSMQFLSVYKIYQEQLQQSAKINLICKQLNIKEGIQKYCLSSSLHGLKYVGDKHNTLLERLFWLISFFTAIGFALFFITNLYGKYGETPVIISFNPKMVKINEIPFPAITICNVNIALRSRAESLNNYGTYVKKQLLSDLCDRNSSFQNGTEEYDDSDLDWPVVKEMIIDMNQKCNEMFKVCKWDGNYRKCPDIINTILTDEGFCCSFNRMPVNYSLKNYDEYINNYPKTIIDWNPEDGYPQDTPSDAFPYRSFGPGVSLGLTLVLDANLAQYYCTTTSSIGFKALLSTPTESPKMADIGMLITPGQETRIAIDVDIEDATVGVANIHYKDRQCFFARERQLRFYRIYTERNCRLECEANFTLVRCGCVPYFLPRDQSTKVCGRKTETCSDQARYVIERYTTERAKCDCLPACYEINYITVSATAGNIKKEYDSVEERFLQNVTREYFAENMAVVHFYFPLDKFPKRTKSEMYGFAEFLSNTGGLLGLFLGFSFMSVVELLYFLCLSSILKLLSNRYVGNRPKQRQEHHEEMLVYPYVN